MTDKRLRCEAFCEGQEIEAGKPFSWGVNFQNTSNRTLYVSHKIHGYTIKAAERVLEATTARPALAPEVHVGFFALETTPADPGESIAQNYTLSLPLRIGRFVGTPPRVEIEEWTPDDDFQLRLVIAFGEQPFYRPGDPAQLPEALRRWERLAPPTTLDLRLAKLRED